MSVCARSAQNGGKYKRKEEDGRERKQRKEEEAGKGERGRTSKACAAFLFLAPLMMFLNSSIFA